MEQDAWVAPAGALFFAEDSAGVSALISRCESSLILLYNVTRITYGKRITQKYAWGAVSVALGRILPASIGAGGLLCAAPGAGGRSSR
jgi:hypothetical protein